MSWVSDLKMIIDRMPDSLPDFTPRGSGISGEMFIHRKVQRQRGTIYWYWVVSISGLRDKYFPYTIDGFNRAVEYRDLQCRAYPLNNSEK